MNAQKIAGATIAVASALMMFATVAPAVAQTTPVIVATPTPVPNHSTLTAAELGKIAALRATYGGRDVSLTVAVSRALGLSASSTVPVRQLSANDDWDEVHVHYFNRVVADPNTILLLYEDKLLSTVYGFLTDSTFVLKAAYVSDANGARPLTTDAARPAFMTEISWWANAVKDVKTK
jgi:hypothetical protein